MATSNIGGGKAMKFGAETAQNRIERCGVELLCAHYYGAITRMCCYDRSNAGHGQSEENISEPNQYRGRVLTICCRGNDTLPMRRSFPTDSTRDLISNLDNNVSAEYGVLDKSQTGNFRSLRSDERKTRKGGEEHLKRASSRGDVS
ncbi:uncharacterized protein CIMG_10824 [Coccidioides immitis RS]|uniref:Uncharacterized protein n=1 Tax=Coccidioides immitis (strain RS) TaxID=246410 RepID=A0A0D8JV17_COCIM|nr:uncharacterized protein CIMG_10824 [Coccidioides immitis RS]KJF60108.1 hypothetical protein CIMG_10824 [Coccidioides immitis RS]